MEEGLNCTDIQHAREQAALSYPHLIGIYFKDTFSVFIQGFSIFHKGEIKTEFLGSMPHI